MLKDNTKVVIVDDTKFFKSSIREDILKDKEWIIIDDNLKDRNVFLIASKKEFSSLLENI